MHYDEDQQRREDKQDEVLHTPVTDFGLRTTLEEVARESAEWVEIVAKGHGMSIDPVVLSVANRLFGQTGYEFRKPFISLAADVYRAPLLQLDFYENSQGARKEINDWVEEQTRDRIQDLIPPDGVDEYTRLALVNATYLKAPWAHPFSKSATEPLPFHVNGVASKSVPRTSTSMR